MKIITISGLDGSGKSTQIHLLKEKLAQKGNRVYDFHMIDFSIGNKMLRKKSESKKQKSGAKTSANFLSIFLRKIALLIDLLRFRRLAKKLSKKDYDYLVTDRYFYDQIVNILFLSSVETGPPPVWQKIAEKLILLPDTAVYLKTKPFIIAKRYPEIEQSIEYLKKKHRIFNKLSKKWQLISINGCKPIEDVQENITNLYSKK